MQAIRFIKKAQYFSWLNWFINKTNDLLVSTKDATTLICTFSKLTNDSIQVIYVFYLSSFKPFNQPKFLFDFIHAGDF